MSGAALSSFNLAGQSLAFKRGFRFVESYFSRLTAGSSRQVITAWILGDFVAVQCAGITTLFVMLLWLVYSASGAPRTDAATVMSYYLGTLVPFSLLLPLLFLANGCYSRAQFRNWRTARLNVLRACLMSAVSYAIARGFGGGLDVLHASAASLFMGLSFSGTLGTRWVKSWLDSPHTRESLPNYVRAVSKDEAPVLVVGGAGYIGSVLVRRLIASGRKVRVLDSLVYGNAALRGLFGHPNMELLVGDCRNIKSVVRAVDGVEAIIHLAAIVGDPACEQERQTALETNYAATRMLIEVAKGAKVRRLIFASTCSVYGASDELMEETSPVRPLSLYAHTKVQSERALLEEASELFHPIILRLATVFGHSYRPRFDLVVNLLTAKAYQEGFITIYNGEQWRPFIHVRDVAEGILTILDTPVSIVGGQILNLGDSRMNYTLAQVAENIRQVFPKTRVKDVENSDRRNYRVSFDKTSRLTGFQSNWGLEDGIRELKGAFEQRLVEDYKLALYSNQCYLKASGGRGNNNEVDTYVMAAFARRFTALAEAGR